MSEPARAGHDKQSINTFCAIVPSTVTFRAKASLRKMSAMEKIDPSAAPKTVLIVEDNELNMKLFTDLLEAHGYLVEQARTGPEALDSARRCQPDLILMDIQLPEISGLQVTEEILKDPSLSKTPIIAVTAFAMKGDEERIRAGGCSDYISKPISVVSFLEKVKRYLE